VTLDPATELVPTYGAKEAIFHLAQVVDGAVAVPAPGYPVAERGALFAGREVVEVPLRAEHGWLPDLDAVPWERIGLLWLISPGNPTATAAPLAFLEEAAARAREHDVVLACDEAYCELWFAGEPPPSALQLADRTGVLAFHTLSKRSSMPGYRSGFVAGDPELIAALKRYRPNVGTAPQTFVQRASVAAWNDDDHVVEIRERYAAKREIVLPAPARGGPRARGRGRVVLPLAEGPVDGRSEPARTAGRHHRLLRRRRVRRAARAGRRRRARLVPGAGRRGPRARRARPHRGAVRARRRAARIGDTHAMSDPGLILLADVHGLAGRENELRALLADLCAGARTEPGCTRYDAFAGAEPGDFLLLAQYTGEDALRAHYAAPAYRRYRDAVGPLLARPSDVVVHRVSGTLHAVDPNPPDPEMLG
jgi:quinol monooxygenase YgiN